MEKDRVGRIGCNSSMGRMRWMANRGHQSEYNADGESMKIEWDSRVGKMGGMGRILWLWQ